jgi:hypothetical protein
VRVGVRLLILERNEDDLEDGVSEIGAHDEAA